MPFDPDCAHCQGTGWRQVERGGLTGAERCQCGRAAAGPGGIEGLPERYARATLDNFTAKLPGDPNDYDHLTQVLFTTTGFAREYGPAAKKGLLLHGPTGVGKTHLAVGIGKRLAERGHEVVFFDYQSLLQKIRDSYDPAAGSGSKDAYRRALEAEILLLDDLGAHRVTDWVLDTVTQIITHRYNENRTLIATTNCPLRDRARDLAPEKLELRDTLEVAISDRAASRIFEMCRIVEIHTQDYRRREMVPARG